MGLVAIVLSFNYNFQYLLSNGLGVTSPHQAGPEYQFIINHGSTVLEVNIHVLQRLLTS